MAAWTMYGGVGKSGSPAPKPMTGRPAALRALALASTARVADSAIAARRADTRGLVTGEMGALTRPIVARTTRGAHGRVGSWTWHAGGAGGAGVTRLPAERVRPKCR